MLCFTHKIKQYFCLTYLYEAKQKGAPEVNLVTARAPTHAGVIDKPRFPIKCTST